MPTDDAKAAGKATANTPNTNNAIVSVLILFVCGCFSCRSGAAQLPAAGGARAGPEGRRRRHDLVGPGKRRRHDAHPLDGHDHRSAEGKQAATNVNAQKHITTRTR